MSARFTLDQIDKMPPAIRAQIVAGLGQPAKPVDMKLGHAAFTPTTKPHPGKLVDAKPFSPEELAGPTKLFATNGPCLPGREKMPYWKQSVTLPAPPAKSPPTAINAAMQAILPQCPKVKVKSKVPKQDESRMQQEVIRWFRDNAYEWQMDEELLMAFPLQGARSARNGARMKAEGMRRGTPDMLLAVPRGDCCALWIEMKTAKGYLNPFQKLMLKRLTLAGAATVVCRSAEEAQHAIRAYLNLPTPTRK